MGIGIEKLGVYPCALSLDIAGLCEARGLDAANFCGRFFCDERSVVGPFEDVVTLAVNAAMPMLSDADRDAIRLLIVATESAPDQEKPVSSWVHRFLGLRSDCRNFEVKHACYGATGALHLAAGWLQSADAGAKALIVNADHALLHLDGPQEPVLGAAGVQTPGAFRIAFTPMDTANTVAQRIEQALLTNSPFFTITAVSVGNMVNLQVSPQSPVPIVTIPASTPFTQSALAGGFGGQITGIEVVGNSLYAVTDTGTFLEYSRFAISGPGANPFVPTSPIFSTNLGAIPVTGGDERRLTAA